nr:cysteine hydrolase [Nitrospiraceae bacterium]
ASWHIYSMMRRFNVKEPEQLPSFMAPGSKEREIADAVRPEKGALLLEKPAASIFIGTNFENMMRAKGVTTLLFTGISTEFGIESSARDASNRGFYPVVIRDCVSSPDREGHERSLKNMEKLLIVESSAGVLKNID